MPHNKNNFFTWPYKGNGRELCAVLLQAFYLTLDSTAVISVFLIMWYLLILHAIQLQALSAILSIPHI